MLVDFDTSTERLVFVGTTEEDKAYAKTFWQSIYLLPHIESGLVSMGITQRLRSAPLPGVEKNCHPEGDTELADYFKKVLEAQKVVQQQRINRLANLREEDRLQLARARLRREQMEQRLYAHKFRKVLPPIQKSATAAESMEDIDEFERKILRCDRPDTA
jgi:hypothetical protein